MTYSHRRNNNRNGNGNRVYDHDGEKEDAMLFRFWIQEASVRPIRLSKAIAHCVTPDDYRRALHDLLAVRGAALLSPIEGFHR